MKIINILSLFLCLFVLIISACSMNCVIKKTTIEEKEIDNNIYKFTFLHNYFCTDKKLQPSVLNEIYNFMSKNEYRTFEIIDQFDDKNMGGIYYCIVKFNK